MTSFGAVPAEPESDKDTLPPELCAASVSELLPTDAGAYVAVRGTVAPETSIEPGAGSPVTPNGADGSVKAVNVRAWLPVFERTALAELIVPAATVPNERLGGE